MRLPTLRPRLAMTAGLVPHGAAAADIGTDHAYLPVYLVREGVCSRVIAADVSEGPLQNAAKAVSRAGLEQSVELRLSDGFGQFAPTDADCWIIAGMGGTLIVRLLEQTPWLREPEPGSAITLILQPMRHAWEVRQWLLAHGYRIEMETACHDAGRPYHAMRAVFDPGYAKPIELSYIYMGELPRCNHPAVHELIRRERVLLQTRADALAKSGRAAQNEHELTRLRAAVAGMEERL